MRGKNKTVDVFHPNPYISPDAHFVKNLNFYEHFKEIKYSIKWSDGLQPSIKCHKELPKLQIWQATTSFFLLLSRRKLILLVIVKGCKMHGSTSCLPLSYHSTWTSPHKFPSQRHHKGLKHYWYEYHCETINIV